MSIEDLESDPSTGSEVKGSLGPEFMVGGRASLGSIFKEAANWSLLKKTPYGLVPAVVLAVAGLFQAFDSVAFGIVGPDIVRDLELDLPKVLIALNIVGFFMIFGTLLLGWLLDRTHRVRLVSFATILSGAFSLITTRARTEPMLGVARAGDAVSETAADLPRFSLLTDYYPPEVRGRLFALMGTIRKAATLAAPLFIGYVIVTTTSDPNHPNWRLPFFVTAPGLILVGFLMMFVLKEPIRGYMERRAIGLSEEESKKPEQPPSFGEAWRTIWSIRTLRRFFIAAAISGVGSLIYLRLFQFFLAERYGLDTFQRGILSAIAAVFVVFGGYLGGGVVDSLTRRRPQRVLIFYGLLGIISSLFLFVQAAGPPVVILAGGLAMFAFFGALLGPAGAVIIAQILPAHIRSQGLAVFVLADIPATILFFVVASQLNDWGLQGGLFSSAPFILLGSIVALTAADVFERDMRAAIASQSASQEYLRARESGRAKLLVCRDIDVEYDGVQVLFGVDFDVDEGEIIALLGTNGAGKSTLLKAIAGSQEASSGAVVADGRDITHMPPDEIARRGISLMPGGKGIFPGLSVTENLVLGQWAFDSEEARDRMQEIYRIFPVLKERGKEQSGLLSGGEQQMLSLAQAFLSNPKLLMIDELSLGLSPAVTQQLIEIVKAFHERGTTVILVEQSVNVALTVAKKAIFMEKGEVKFVGNTEDLLSRPEILRAVYVKGTGGLTDSHSSSRTLKSQREVRKHELDSARPVLEVKDLTKRFGGITAVSNLSFNLREGEILGLIGPNGAGKTTVFDLIAGYQFPDSGRVIYNGRDVTAMGPDERARLGLIRRFQDARLFPSLSVFENVLMALDLKIDVRSMALTAIQVPQVRAAERRVRLRAERLVELLDLQAYRDKFVRELSTGLRRITDLACVLASEPKVLLLDEPSTGIAQAEAEMLAPLLRRIGFETGCSILMIEHDMPLISSVSDELLAMDQGQTVVRGEPLEVLNNEQVIHSYLGTSEDVIQRSGIRK